MAYEQPYSDPAQYESAHPGAAPNSEPVPESAPNYTQEQPGVTGTLGNVGTGADGAALHQTQPGSTDNVEFAEPALPAVAETVSPDEVEPMSVEEFAQDDPYRVYERMRPDQRTAIAGEFIRLFRLSGDPDAQRYDTEISEMWPPDRVAELHQYAQQHHPEIFEEVTHHPVTQASLETPGVVVQTGDAGEAAVPGQVADIPDKHDASLLP